MPKMKSRSGARKRFKITGNGKIKRKRAFRNHILTKKSSKRKRQLRQESYVDASNEKAIRKLMPYGS